MTKYHIAVSGKSAGKWVPCKAEHNCRIGGQHITSEALIEAVDKGDVNAYIAAREKEDTTSKIDGFFSIKKKENRKFPPYTMQIAETSEGSVIFMTPSGKVYEKQYDIYGAGVGSSRIMGASSYKKAARKMIDEAWKIHDEEAYFASLPKEEVAQAEFDKAYEMYKDIRHGIHIDYESPDTPAKYKKLQKFLERHPSVDMDVVDAKFWGHPIHGSVPPPSLSE